MRYIIVGLALSASFLTNAQTQKDVRVEKRVIVLKDGKMLDQPSDSVLKELRINVDSIVEGFRLTPEMLGGEGLGGNVMIFNDMPQGRAVLGVRIGQTNGVAGVVVQSVEPVSTAAALGLSVGDVVYRVNGRNLQKPEDLVGLISELEVGAEVAIAYRRDGKKRRALGYLIPAGVLGGMMPPAGEMPLRIELKAPREF